MTDTPQAPGPDNDTSILGLVGQLVHEVPVLISKEIALAKAEFRESLNTAQAGGKEIAGGIMLMLAGLVILLLGVVQILAWWLASWLAALLVGIAAMAGGMMMLKGGNRQLKLTSLTPERTVEAFNKDKDVIQRKAS
ncbi:putative uncharacterized protein [Pseudomonas sp. StFLB209]|uniref:phage holin family protein n=2 Tax=Pseudomonadota TaxID=1224 RepID=UPI0004F8BFF5|nr:phage holin family protein [Pseudomonas sp. StFLB209]BAP44275.1 putative uncharacterized protein [Pseudomonas sp. StFLB209]